MEKEVFNAEKHKPRELTRKEIKQLREAGLHLHYVKGQAAEKVEDFTDFVLDNFYPGIDFDSVSQKDCITFATTTFKLTYGAEDEVKN